jgi:hypothetical protein
LVNAEDVGQLLAKSMEDGLGSVVANGEYIFEGGAVDEQVIVTMSQVLISCSLRRT